MPKALTVLLTTLSSFLFSATVAQACRCAPLTVERANRLADAVVLAKVKSRHDAAGFERIYRIDVVESWKRRLRGPLTISSENSTCVADLDVGERYLIYLDALAKGYETTSCSGNLPAKRSGIALQALRGRRRGR